MLLEKNGSEKETQCRKYNNLNQLDQSKKDPQSSSQHVVPSKSGFWRLRRQNLKYQRNHGKVSELTIKLYSLNRVSLFMYNTIRKCKTFSPLHWQFVIHLLYINLSFNKLAFGLITTQQPKLKLHMKHLITYNF